MCVRYVLEVAYVENYPNVKGVNMKTYSVNGNKISEEEVRQRYFGLYCTDNEDTNRDVEEYAKNNGIKWMAKALRYFYRGGEEDFYVMIHEV